MPFERPTLANIISRIVSDFEVTLGIGTLLRRSILKIMARVFGGAVHLLYGYLDYLSKQLFATTADTEYLEQIANEYGIIRRSATKAVGSGIVTGTAGSLISEGARLQSSDGRVYRMDIAYTVEVSGSVTIDVTAEEAGESSNQDASSILNFISPITGVNTSVVMDSNGLHSGTDEESDTELRMRILDRKRYPPHGGTEHDIINWCKEISGVTRAWTISQYYGDGTVGIAFVRDGDVSIIPNDAQMEEVKQYLLEHDDPVTGESVGIPICGEMGLMVISLTLLQINFEIHLYPNTAAVRTSVQDELEDLIYREGGPGETLYLSRISEAISAALGEGRHILVSPTSNVVATSGQVHVLGTIIWGTLT